MVYIKHVLYIMYVEKMIWYIYIYMCVHEIWYVYKRYINKYYNLCTKKASAVPSNPPTVEATSFLVAI